MKKYVIFLCIAFLGTALWSCKEKEDTPVPDQEMALTAPADGAAINLANVQDVSFEWTVIEGVGGYKLVVSQTQDLKLPQTKAATAHPFKVSASDFDAIVAGFNITGGGSTTLYWSIEPVRSPQNIITQVRTMNVTRLPKPVIVLPETSGVTIDLNDYQPYTFSFIPVKEVSAYTIKFALGNDKFNSSDDCKSIAIPADADTYEFADAASFDEMLTNFGMTFGESQTVYWTVEPTVPNSEIVTQVRQFTAV